MTDARTLLLSGSALFLAAALFLCLLRAALGPRFTDRVVAGNVVGTLTVLLIAILALALDEPYLADVCLVYALVNFVSVVVLARSVLEENEEASS